MLIRPPIINRFNPEVLFHPRTILLSGGNTPTGSRLRSALATCPARIVEKVGDEPIDLALIADRADNVPHMLGTLSGQVSGAAIIYAKVENLRETAVAARVRVIGSRSFGLAVPGIALNALLTDAPVPSGRVALLAQSHALARAVIDWAEPNGVGFSTIVGIGDNADIGFGRILDHLSRDPGTGPIMMEISGLRDPRLFLSAAKAAARLRPIVAIAPGGRLADPRFMAMAGFESALARAGVLLTSTLGTFLAAAETLSRARPARNGGLAIIGNSRGGCRLAADAVLAAGYALAPLTSATNQALALLGTDPITEALITVLDAPGSRLAALVAVLGAAPEVGGIIVILAPSDADDDATTAALIACAADTNTPLLTAILGQSTGAVRRRRLAEAGVAVFATPEDAVAGYSALSRHRAIRTIARELPSSTVLDIEPDRAAVAKAIAATRTEGRTDLSREAALSVLRAYGIDTVESEVATTPETVAAAAANIGFPVVVKLTAPTLTEPRPVGSLALDLPDAPSAEAAARLIETRLRGRGEFPPDACFIVQRQIDHARILRITMDEYLFVGPIIGFGVGGGDIGASQTAELPPLNLALADAMIERAGGETILLLSRGSGVVDRTAVAAALVRVSQLIIDWPDFVAFSLDPVFAAETGVSVGNLRMTLRPPGQVRPPLPITPYPVGLVVDYLAQGRSFTIRPIRPEDAAAHERMFERLDPEDIRFRFFSAIQTLSIEQIVRMTEIDYGREMALIAIDQSSGETAGVARLVRSDTDGLTGEFAILVESGAKGIGLGSALMQQLIAWAKQEGVVDIVGDILADNHSMLAFVRHLGFTLGHRPNEGDVVEVHLRIKPGSPPY